MIIVRVCFTDWNGNKRAVDVTSEMTPVLNSKKDDEELIITAIHYVKCRHSEWYNINSVEIIAR